MIKAQTGIKHLIAFLALVSLATCCPGDEYCLFCDVTSPVGECVVCDRSFFNMQTLKCDTNIRDSDPNCLTYTAEDKTALCQECAFGFRLTTDHKCVPCKKENCAICDENDRCWACRNGVKPHETTSECSESEKCPDENCAICQGFQGKWGCSLCKEGFAISDFTNRSCVASKVGCQLIDAQQPGKCLQCLSGYYIDKDEICQKRTEPGSHYFFYIGGLILVMILGGVLYKVMKRDRNPDVYLLNNADD